MNLIWSDVRDEAIRAGREFRNGRPFKDDAIFLRLFAHRFKQRLTGNSGKAGMVVTFGYLRRPARTGVHQVHVSAEAGEIQRRREARGPSTDNETIDFTHDTPMIRRRSAP